MTALLEIRNLQKHFPVRGGFLRRVVAQVKAVDGVSFTLEFGKTLGLVGESGCGKSTLGRAILQLQKPTGGQVILEGEDLTAASPARLLRDAPRDADHLPGSLCLAESAPHGRADHA